MAAILALLAACALPATAPRHGPADTGTPMDSDTGSLDTGPLDTGPLDTGATPSSCPPAMVEVDSIFCIDQAEAALEERIGDSWSPSSPYLAVDGRTVRAVVALGTMPQAYISGDEAEAACQAAGKRLCSSEEWLRACQGPNGWTWPYGDEYREGACNDDYAGSHPVVDYFGTSTGIWDTESMNDPGINQQPGTVSAGGSFAECQSAWGAFDLHGNLHEWVAEAEGTFRGGFYADASINGQGCGYQTTAHDRGYHDYSTGFRCCAERLVD